MLVAGLVLGVGLGLLALWGLWGLWAVWALGGGEGEGEQGGGDGNTGGGGGGGFLGGAAGVAALVISFAVAHVAEAQLLPPGIPASGSVPVTADSCEAFDGTVTKFNDVFAACTLPGGTAFRKALAW